MRSLLLGYRAIVCDLDGVVFRGPTAIPYAVGALLEADRAGACTVYATNNASRPPTSVVEKLAGLGLPDAAVVTSSQAGAAYLRRILAVGSRVLAVGGPGVALALEDAGLTPVRAAQSEPGERFAAVLQGFGADVGWRDLAEAAFAIAGGALWVATNRDATLPTERGQAPGNGALVAAVQCATHTEPQVVGKPEPDLYQLAAEALGTPAEQTLAIGDRLDTDIAGARRAGMDAVWVATGVHNLRDVARAATDSRPTYLLADLRGLHLPYQQPQLDTDGWFVCGSARAQVRDGRIHTRGPSAAEASPDERHDPADTSVRCGERLRVIAYAYWLAADDARENGAVMPEPDDAAWQSALAWAGCGQESA